MNFQKVAEDYRDLLQNNLLPWWLNHAIDRDLGGICTCIGDDGTIVNHDKYVWSQLRALWTFSAAWNRIACDEEYLAVANQLFEFVIKIDGSQKGEGPWLVCREGKVKEGPESIQTDAFAICAMVEYARTSGKEEAVEAAMRTYRSTVEKLRRPGSYKTKPYPVPDGTKAQRVSMQFSLAYGELGRLTGDKQIVSEAMKLTNDVLDNFRRPDLEATVEYLGLDNSLLDPPVGTLCGPGHGIETAWFQFENIGRSGDSKRLEKALDIMRWSFEKGWDSKFGGLFHLIDLNGGEPYLPHPDKKLFWVHSEALCGSLMAYEICGEDWCLDWYDKTYDWSFAHFPDREHGEWKQKLDRAGNPLEEVIALPVKDPFHLPRAVIYAIESLERMNGENV